MVAGAFSYAFAQAPTFDFESWNGNDPTGWVSANAVSLLGNPQSVFKETASVHSGTAAMKLVTVTLTNNPSPASIPNPMGAAFPGVVNLSPLGMADGCQFTGRPATVDFWYKYAPVGGDSAACVVFLTKWNTNRDTIAYGVWSINSAVSSYALSSINMIYNGSFSNMLPDTLHLYFTSTCYGTLTCGTAGSTLWVDDISFNGWNGINENPDGINVSVFPNPAADLVNIHVDALSDAYTVSVFDVEGKAIMAGLLSPSSNGMNRKSAVINTTSMASGIYTYRITNEQGQSLRSGKFSVSK